METAPMTSSRQTIHLPSNVIGKRFGFFFQKKRSEMIRERHCDCESPIKGCRLGIKHPKKMKLWRCKVNNGGDRGGEKGDKWLRGWQKEWFNGWINLMDESIQIPPAPVTSSWHIDILRCGPIPVKWASLRVTGRNMNLDSWLGRRYSTPVETSSIFRATYYSPAEQIR